MDSDLAFQQHKPVEVNQRALIDKVLARYSGEFTLFRELLQNSEDAGCDTVEIRFETAAYSPEHKNADPPALTAIEATNVTQWTFKNKGSPFTEEDWSRLPKIAEGNPDPQKVGTFGVGFYSLFSVTERPHVLSGGKEMEFSWNDGNQLYYRFAKRSPDATSDAWTTFRMPLRKPSPMPRLLSLMEFLALSITFVANLKHVTVFFDQHRLGYIHKIPGCSQPVTIPLELKLSSPEKIMTVKAIQRHLTTMEAGIVYSPYNDASCEGPRKSLPMYKSKVDLTAFTAAVDVIVDEKLSKELNRCMKKEPPSRLKFSLIYTGKEEYDRSCINEQNYPGELGSIFQGLRADLDGAAHTRIFIGHSTAQTTGVGGHMESYFIPTVERALIDLVDKNVATWNRELLYVGGLLCRVVYESELSKIQSSWEYAVVGSQDPRPSQETQSELNRRFLHVLKFFTFHRSTPSPEVARLLAKSFYGCSTIPLRLLSSVGVRKAPEVRGFDPVYVRFLKDLPMLSEDVTRDGEQSVAALPGPHKILPITLADVLKDLRGHAMSEEELDACLRWWITSKGCDSTSNTAALLSAATLCGLRGQIRLSSITHFVNPMSLGLYIPQDGPLPMSLIPLGISKRFVRDELRSFGWEEFTVALWLHHISQSKIMSADEKYDFTRSPDWAERVLATVYSAWSSLSDEMRIKSKKVLRKACIPTSKGLRLLEDSYLPIADYALLKTLDLPVVGFSERFTLNADITQFLAFIGVRTSIPVHTLSHQMLFTGHWNVFELVTYIVRVQTTLSNDELREVKSTKLFWSERKQNNADDTRYRADELYPPMDIFRKLQLPVIDWGGKSWRETSPEARLLYQLGLNQFPPLPEIVELCSSKDASVQENAFAYLCNHLHSQYQDYRSETFRDMEFIPAECKAQTCLKKLGDVYTGGQWEELGFFVVQARHRSKPLHQLGVVQHPPTSKLLELLETSPPKDEKISRRWFEVLSEHLTYFSPHDLTKLSELPIVPTGPLGSSKLLPPSKCYLDDGTKHVLYSKLFVFVNFGTEANRFLAACFSKNKPSVEDVAEALVEDPERFYKLTGGKDCFLAELREFAYQRRDLSNDTLNKFCQKPTLLGVCRKRAEGGIGWAYEHLLLKPEQIVIIDDTNDYQLFSDLLFTAPQEDGLERFYEILGCRRLTTVVSERYNEFREIQDIKTCSEVQSLILERLPLYIEKYSDAKAKIPLPSTTDELRVKACEKITVSKTLMTGSENVTRTRDVWAIGRREGNHIKLWLSKTAERDMYEVASSLSRLLFGTTKINDTLLLGGIFSMGLEVLERRGFSVDRIPMQRREGETWHVTNTMHEKGASSASHPSHEPMPDALSESDSTPESFPGGSGATSLASHCLGVKSVHSIENSALAFRTPRDVVPLDYVRKRAEGAIEACYSRREKSYDHIGMSDFLNSGVCAYPEHFERLRLLGNVKDIQVHAAEGVSKDTVMDDKKGPLARFVDIILSLSDIYRIPATKFHVFYDVSGGCIAFNSQGTIYLNLRYFEAWHDDQVKNGNPKNAQISWFLALAHEMAHNLTDQHNSEHEFWFSAICEARLDAFSLFLRPTEGVHYALVPGLVVIAILLAYLVSQVTLCGTVMRCEPH